MKINVKKSVVLEDVDVRVRMTRNNENGCIEFIDFVQRCPDCDELHILQRFVPVDDDLLQVMLDDTDDDYDADEEFYVDKSKERFLC